MNERAREFWSRTKLVVWPQRYSLVSLPLDHLAEAAKLLATCGTTFAGLILERDEVSLTIDEDLWRYSRLRWASSAVAGPYRVLTLDVNVGLHLVGYLAPAAERLASAEVSIIPQCGFLKDHLLVTEEDLPRAVATLEKFLVECRG